MIRFVEARLGYASRTVLSGVNLAIDAGDFVGVVGPNGSGKTTFLRSVLGLLPPLSGTATVDRSRRFAYVPQVDDLNQLWPLSVRDMVAMPHRAHRVFGQIPRTTWDQVDAAIEKTGLSTLSGRRYNELSGGQRQRTLLAQALSQTPDVLLLDEPTRGLDVRAERDFLSLLTDLNEREKLTILFVTHTLAIPINVTGKIVIVHDGRVTTASPADIVRTDKLAEIYGMAFVHGESEGVRWVAPAKAS